MPDTSAYLYLGLAAITVIMLMLIASMVLRYRSLQQDIKTLEKLDDPQ